MEPAAPAPTSVPPTTVTQAPPGPGCDSTDLTADSEGLALSQAFPAVSQVDPKWTQSKILKNVVVVSMSFLFLFTAFQSLSNLQTSLNLQEDVGAQSLSAIYGALILSCIFLPKFVIAHMGCKWAIPVSMVPYALYMLANIYPQRWIMVLAGIGVGIGGAPLWSAKCAYVTQIGVWYAVLTRQSEDAIINKLFGLFFMMFQTSQVWGNLISSEVLKAPESNSSSTVCGGEFIPSENVEKVGDKFKQPFTLVRNLCIIYLCCALLAIVIVSALLDPIKLDQVTSEEDRRLSPRLLVATVRHLISSPAQVLLVPLSMYSGIEQAFIVGDYPQAYISCSLGVKSVGYIMICFGIMDSICSMLFGRLVQYVGHSTFFGLATLVHGSLQIAMTTWKPNSDSYAYFYLIAAFWGMGDAVIQTQMNALYGALFTENTEAAFANYRLWESLGFLMCFLYQSRLRTKHKLYVCLTFLFSGMLGYVVVEVIERRKLSRQRSRDA